MPIGQSRRSAGWALVSVLWLLSILALLAATMGSLSFDTALHEKRALDAARGDDALDAAIVQAITGLSRGDPHTRWRADGATYEFEFDGRKIAVTVQDQFGMIDLNAADGSLISQLLRSAGLDEAKAREIAANILDWRRHHDATLAAETTDDDYRRAGLAYRPRHDAFRSVDELKLVLGVTPSLFAKVAPSLTVYSHHPAVDTDMAPRGVLAAYYPDQAGRVADLLADRHRAKELPQNAAAPVRAGQVIGLTVNIAKNGNIRRRSAVILLTSSPSRPYLTYLWR